MAGGSYVGQNFSGEDLSGADLSGAKFTACNFSGADLHGADASSCTFTGCNLSGTSLDGADFTGVRLTGCNLSDASVDGADFTDATFTGCNWLRVDMESADGLELSDQEVNSQITMRQSSGMIQVAGNSRLMLDGGRGTMSIVNAGNQVNSGWGNVTIGGVTLQGSGSFGDVSYEVTDHNFRIDCGWVEFEGEATPREFAIFGDLVRRGRVTVDSRIVDLVLDEGWIRVESLGASEIRISLRGDAANEPSEEMVLEKDHYVDLQAVNLRVTNNL
jgi:hypothetical protein